MLYRLFFLLLSLSLITGASSGDNISKGELELMYERIMREIGGSETLALKGAPDSATYITVGSFLFAPIAAEDGFIFLSIEARVPGADRDTLYSGVVYPHAIEEFPNNSVTFYPSIWWQYPDTTTPLDSIFLSEGGSSIWVKNSEPEQVILYLTSQDGFKPSLPTSCTFDTSGTSATQILIEGQERMYRGEAFPDGIGTRSLVKIIDAQGYVVSGYGDLFDTSVVVSVIEQNPNGSAGVLDFRTFQWGQEIRAGLVGGIANLFLWNTEEESLRLVAESDDPQVAPDTFLIQVIPETEPLYILPFSSGTYGTVNIDKGIIAVAMTTEWRPDMNNNTSEVELRVYDIMGAPSASIYPEGTQTLISGMSSFTLGNSEPDSGVIVEIIPSGVPELYPHWFLGDKVVYGFRQPGEAVMMRASLPSVAVVGDTVTGYIYAEDAAAYLDTLYNGWIRVSATGSAQVMEYGTGNPDNIIPIVNGIGRFWLTDSVIETVVVSVEDAEGSPPFRAYLGTPALFEYGVEISFEAPGATATQWVIDADESGVCGYPVAVTIKACDDLGLIDTSFSDTARVTGSGFATPQDTNMFVLSGIATLDITTDSTETVELVVSGGGLTPDTVFILFRPSGEAVQLFPMASMENLVNDSVRVNFYAMNRFFVTDTTYNGFTRMSITDPGDTSVIFLEGDPDSIPIRDGVGTLLFTNSEIEVILADITEIEPPLQPPPGTGELEFEGKLSSAVPESANVDTTDNVVFMVVDVNGSLMDYNSLIDSIWVDEIGGTFPSVTLDPPDSIQITGGIGILRISNAEPETVMVYAWVSDPLIQDRAELVGRIIFTEVGIEEDGQRVIFLLNSLSPNPFTGIAEIEYGIPKALPVSLKVYDLAGRVVETLISERKKPGYYTIKWDARDRPSGVYFIRLDAGDWKMTEKLILLK